MALESWNSVIPGLQNSKLVESLMGTSWEREETEREKKERGRGEKQTLEV